MTDKKLTDEEIIEALDLCTQQNGSIPCYDCPCWNDDEQECKGIDYTATLDLIKRQRTEIEELNIQLQKLWNMASLYKAENERFEDYNKNLLTANTALSNEFLEAKAEAYKEFAKRLKSYLLLNKKGEMSVISFENVDTLLKEMVEEKE